MFLERYVLGKVCLKKKSLDFRRINNILFLKEMLFGRHLIVKAENSKESSQSFGHYVKKEIQRYYPR